MASFKEYLIVEATEGNTVAGTVTKNMLVVFDGIKKFLRLTALRQDPKEQRWIRDENDLIDALEIIKKKFHETKSMIGKKKYRDSPFDFTDDVKLEMEELLLRGRDEKETLLQRKRNLVMYHLILEPVIEIFSGFEHKEALRHVNRIIDSIIRTIKNSDVKSHYDDALVTREQIRDMIKQRDEQRKMNVLARKRGKKEVEKKPLIIDDLDIELDV